MIAQSSTKKEFQEYAMANFGVKLHGGMSESSMFKKIQELEKQNGMREEAQNKGQASEEEVTEAGEKPTADKESTMNMIANAIWQGQSVSLPRHERERRIKAALVDKGYSDCLDKLELPE